MLGTKRISFKVFVSPISEGNGCTGEDVFDSPIKTGALSFRSFNRIFDGFGNGDKTRLVSADVTCSGTGLEIIIGSCSQK